MPRESDLSPSATDERAAAERGAAATDDDVGAALRRARVRASLFGTELAAVKIARFTVLEQIGGGSMGEVYAAYDDKLDRRVAIKLVQPGFQASEVAKSRLLREARALAKLAHDNVVRVYEVGAVRGRVFIAMELVRGQTLRDYVRVGLDGVPTARRRRAILRGYLAAGRGLEAAHGAGLTHRDFKPDNVMVSDSGRVVVIDFGLARAGASDNGDVAPGATATDPELTHAGAVIGTPRYMSPEQLDAEPADELSDQFSFCVALYEGLTGDHPFVRRATGFDELRAAVLAATPHPSPRDAAIPGRLRRAVARGLARDPAARYPSMTALLGEIEAALARPRRTWLAAIAAAAIAATVASVVARGGAAETPVCAGAATELAAIWNADRRDTVERAVVGADAAYATVAWPRVERGIAAYAESWTAMHRSACLAHHGGAQSAALLDRRMACLQRRKIELDTSLYVLVRDAASAAAAIDVVRALAPIERCADVDALLAEVPLPDQPSVRVQVSTLRTELARVAALEAAGAYADAIELADAQVDAARATGYRPVLAEALLAYGRAIVASGQHTRRRHAVAPLRAAALLALEVGMEALAVEALARLVYAEGTWSAGGDPFAYVPVAEALSARVSTGATLRVLLWNNAATAHRRRDELDAARHSYRQAVDALDTLTDPPLELLEARVGLAQLSFEPERRSELLAAVVARLEVALGPEHPWSLRRRATWARFTQDPRAALAILGPACQGWEEYHPSARLSRVRCAHELNSLRRDVGEAPAALHAVADDSVQWPRVERHVVVGFAYYDRGEYAAAARAFRAGVAEIGPVGTAWWQLRDHGKTRLGLGLSLVELGDASAAARELAAAVAAFEQLESRSVRADDSRWLARARVAAARAVWAIARNSSARRRADEMLGDAQTWYRQAGPSYAPMLEQLAQWRRDRAP